MQVCQIFLGRKLPSKLPLAPRRLAGHFFSSTPNFLRFAPGTRAGTKAPRTKTSRWSLHKMIAASVKHEKRPCTRFSQAPAAAAAARIQKKRRGRFEKLKAKSTRLLACFVCRAVAVKKCPAFGFLRRLWAFLREWALGSSGRWYNPYRLSQCTAASRPQCPQHQKHAMKCMKERKNQVKKGGGVESVEHEED